jgi:hypothetical protein
MVVHGGINGGRSIWDRIRQHAPRTTKRSTGISGICTSAARLTSVREELCRYIIRDHVSFDVDVVFVNQ